MTDSPCICVEGLHRHYKMGREIVRALAGISLKIHSGQFTSIAGSSGSGKSTLLYLLGGLDRPTSGSIRVMGQELGQFDQDQLAVYRQKFVGIIYQMFNLIPTMTALENVEFPLLFSKTTTRQRRERAAFLLEIVGLASRMDHRPTELSGGQQQRVAIARALLYNPPIILADEPTGNLDSHSGQEVMVLLKRLNRDEGRTIIIVSHDPSIIAETDYCIHLKDGLIISENYAPNQLTRSK